MESMERPTCPNCGELLRETILEQLLVDTWDEFAGGVAPGPSGIWEAYCGDCFGDLSFDQAQAFRAYLATLPPPPRGSLPTPPPAGLDLFLKLQHRPGEDQESIERRWARAHKHRGPLRF
jgi:hypothetical protein